MKMSLLLLSLLAAILVSSEALAANVVCLSPTGAITVEKKCKAPKRRMDASSLSAMGIQGPQGPAGKLSTSCRVVVNNQSTTNGAAWVTASCDANSEFLMTWGYFYEPYTSLAFLRQSFLSYNGQIPISITVATQVETDTYGNPSSIHNYRVYVTAVCCQR